MKWIELNEIVDKAKTGKPITKTIVVRADSINTIKNALFMGFGATQVNLQNDCIWVIDSPEMIMAEIDAVVI